MPATLAAGATCTINLRFSPGATLGVRNDTLTITDNSNNVAGSTQTVSLTGEGVAPVASVNPTSLLFGNVQVGSTPPTQDVTVSNTGTAPLTISGFSVTGAGFARVTGFVGSCATGGANAVPAGGSCTVRIRFTPAGGPVSGQLTITDNSNLVAGSTQTVALSGNGTIQANNDSVSATATTGTTATNNVQVRANDAPPSTGTITINAGTVVVTNGGATASVGLNAAGTALVWTTTTSATTNATQRAARRGTYTVTYTLHIGAATSTATATLTLI